MYLKAFTAVHVKPDLQLWLFNDDAVNQSSLGLLTKLIKQLNRSCQMYQVYYKEDIKPNCHSCSLFV